MIEGACKLCGVETAGQLGFLQPLAETFRSMNADKKHRGANGSSSKEYSGEYIEGVQQIFIFGDDKQPTIDGYRLVRGCARLVDYCPSTNPLPGLIGHHSYRRMWDTSDTAGVVISWASPGPVLRNGPGRAPSTRIP